MLLRQITVYKKVANFLPDVLLIGMEVIMKDIFLLLIILVVWFVVNKYVLPRMGVAT